MNLIKFGNENPIYVPINQCTFMALKGDDGRWYLEARSSKGGVTVGHDYPSESSAIFSLVDIVEGRVLNYEEAYDEIDGRLKQKLNPSLTHNIFMTL